MRFGMMCNDRWSSTLLAVAAISLSAGTAHADDLVQKIRATTDTYQRYVDLLDSASQATRIAALTEMTKSKDTALVDLAKSQEVVKLCGDGVQYSIDKFNAETGQFEARGQDHVGVGQINGASLSLTIEYGCSLTGVLQPDGTFSGMVSAPYRKEALSAKFAFR